MHTLNMQMPLKQYMQKLQGFQIRNQVSSTTV